MRIIVHYLTDTIMNKQREYIFAETCEHEINIRLGSIYAMYPKRFAEALGRIIAHEICHFFIIKERPRKGELEFFNPNYEEMICKKMECWPQSFR